MNLNILSCASTEDQNVIEKSVSETSSKGNFFSRHLDATLLERILQYDAKSSGRVAITNRNLRDMVKVVRSFKFYEGAGWDMPELANIRQFGVTETRNRPELDAEMNRIMALSHIKDEVIFNKTLETLLLQDKAFKVLASPVLKYLIRRFYERKEILNDNYFYKRRQFLIFVVENRLYDVFFEMNKDLSFWNRNKLENMPLDEIHDSFYFDCYNNNVFNNPAASDYMWKKMKIIEPSDYEVYKTNDIKLSRIELNTWSAVCIYRRVPVEKYAPFLFRISNIFLQNIQKYIYNYSPITLDTDEKDYFHEFINNLLDKYFADNNLFEYTVKFAKLLNDVRFGYVNESVFKEYIERLDGFIISRKIIILMLAASKANKKSLVKMLANHLEFNLNSLESFVDSNCPHSFKVCFDIMENVPILDGNGRINYAGSTMIQAICSRNETFKVTKAIPDSFGVTFKLQTPADYEKLGFAPKYDIVIGPYNHYISKFIQNMFDDAAKIGFEEFVRVVTEYCSFQVVGPKFYRFKCFEVSYEVIKLLLEHQELINLLANSSAKLTCHDDRIIPEEIAKFRRVINPIE